MQRVQANLVRALLDHEVLNVGSVGAQAPVDGTGGEAVAGFKLHTGILHGTGVDGHGTEAGILGNGHIQEHVLGGLVEPVHRESEGIVQHAQVQAQVDLLGSFPLEVGVGIAFQVITGIEQAADHAAAAAGHRGGVPEGTDSWRAAWQS